jgi:flagellar motor switch protein FliM
MPYSTIEPIKGKLYSGFQSEQLEKDSSWTSRIHEQLHNMTVNIVVELGSTVMSAGDVMNLGVGDIITFDKKVTEPLLAKVEGIPKFLGSAGQLHNSKAFQLRSLLHTPAH